MLVVGVSWKVARRASKVSEASRFARARNRLALHGPMHVGAESPKLLAQVTEHQYLVNAGSLAEGPFDACAKSSAKRTKPAGSPDELGQ